MSPRATALWRAVCARSSARFYERRRMRICIDGAVDALFVARYTTRARSCARRVTGCQITVTPPFERHAAAYAMPDACLMLPCCRVVTPSLVARENEHEVNTFTLRCHTSYAAADDADALQRVMFYAVSLPDIVACRYAIVILYAARVMRVRLVQRTQRQRADRGALRALMRLLSWRCRVTLLLTPRRRQRRVTPRATSRVAMSRERLPYVYTLIDNIFAMPCYADAAVSSIRYAARRADKMPRIC